ncbi:hypothetical protein RHMOL_Rhmol12G0021400 [Rhododendron molle]|uniref:Uncharacterized protein n=1 Tax=Rhododendron molle TaxID=49168 RepID=A0ACC0LF42_RHOML|nr:hypothetical protein RHMOL_Rhmol12G0021400 [Rhododendron molle]
MGKVTGEEGWISLGPWGNSTGSRKTYKADGPILQITLRLWNLDSGRVRYTLLTSISFQSVSRDGVVIGSSEHFGNPEQGGEATTVRIDTAVEQLRSISALGEAFASLTFHTNLKDYGPYGYRQDYLNDRNSWNYTEKDRVSLGMYGGIIAGFYGYEDGGRLSGLGVFVVPIEGLHIIQDPDCAQHQSEKLKHWDGVMQWFAHTSEPSDRASDGSDLISTMNDSQSLITEIRSEPSNARSNNSEKTEIEELKTKIKELEAENEVLKKRNKEMEKEVELAKPLCYNIVHVYVQGSISDGEGCISSGIGGGKEGAYWTYKADGPVMLISVRYGEAIDSIIFQNKSGDGVGRSVKIGGTGGHTTKTVRHSLAYS